jgi:ankyrin repeat protein
MLAVASETQDVKVVKLLVKAGADSNIRDTSGETALGWASRYGSRSVLDALKLAGAARFTPFKRCSKMLMIIPATTPPRITRTQLIFPIIASSNEVV